MSSNHSHLGIATKVPTRGGAGVTLYYTDSAIAITPSLGAELLANGDFASWTGDNPDGWTVTGESGSNPMVTEAPAGVARFFDSAGAFSSCSQNAAGSPRWTWVKMTAVCTAVVGGSLILRITSDGAMGSGVTAAGTKTFTGLKTTVDINNSVIWRLCDASLDSISLKAITNYSQLFTHAVAYGDFSVTLTRAAGYQGGVIFNYSDANNYCHLFQGGDSTAYLVKAVSGTKTLVGSWSLTYAAGAKLTARRHIDGTIDVIYNGTTLASALTATGLTGLQAGPTLMDAAQVTIGTYEWDARATT